MTGNASALVRDPIRVVAALMLALATCSVARAVLPIDLEIGFRSFTEDPARLFEPGVSLGLATGIDPTPRLRMFARGSVSFHTAAHDSAYEQVSDGVAFEATAGGRFRFWPGSGERKLEPYLAADAGYTFLNWGMTSDYVAALGSYASSRDGLAMLTLAVEGGVTTRAGKAWDVGLAARYAWHRSTDVPSNGFTSQAPNLVPSSQLRFGGDEVGVMIRVTYSIAD